ncbi:MAG: DegV family protein [Ardenticatenaceae bacterium]|nr:DegV family protein [Ardenticatenaceae bacterium]
MSIRIVTDSTCDIPEPFLAELGITVVPVYVNIGQDSYLDGTELSRAEFYRRFGAGERVTTAAPSPNTFTDVYNQLAAAGATEILSLHIADDLSNTGNVARLAGETADIPVTVVDTMQVSVGAGFLVMAAAAAARVGKTMGEITAVLQESRTRIRIFGMLDTLDALRRGGRVNWAQFGIGTLLQIKPILQVYQGDITVAARVRTRKRALQQMVDMVQTHSPLERLAVLHVDALETAEYFQQQLTPYFPAEHPPFMVEITPAVASHFGLGAVGAACVSKL